MAEGYTISGATRSQRNGLYVRLPAACNNRPVYRMEGENHFLFQPIDSSDWWVGSSERLTDCDGTGWIKSSGNGGFCPASPDGAGCAGLWRANTDDCGGESSWCDAPTLAVTRWCPEDSPCCGVDCGDHGNLTVGDACSCSCTDGYSGDRCLMSPLPAGMAEGYNISGAPRSQRNGRYLRVWMECNNKPIYQMEGENHFLFQPIDSSNWWVGSSERLTDCDGTGWIKSSGNGGFCPASPDGAGCAGLWRANTDACGGESSWCDAPTLAVTRWCPEDNLCCGVDCGDHGTLDAGDACSCSCTDSYSGGRCQLPPLLAGMAEGYTISGAPRSQRNGLYVRLPTECNSKPVYQMEGADYVLFQPVDEAEWVIGSSARIADCDNRGWVSSSGNGGWCSTSPDGAGCAGLWRANTDDCGGSSWCNAPALAVTRWCPEDNLCCGVDCGAHGALDAGDACSCSCTDGYSGDRCRLPPLPAGMAESYTISGAPRSQRNGRYVRLPAECNGKPVYQIEGGDCFLFQPTGSTNWWVGDGDNLADCDYRGWVNSDGSCPASPDGAGCAGLWRANTDDCGGSSWCDAPALTVSTP